MLRCGVEEDNEALLARFFGVFNKEIQTILEYCNIPDFQLLFFFYAL
jgi:hypothetical protein